MLAPMYALSRSVIATEPSLYNFLSPSHSGEIDIAGSELSVSLLYNSNVLDYELILEEVIGLSSPPLVVVIELVGTIPQFIKLLVANRKLEMDAGSNKMDHSE